MEAYSPTAKLSGAAGKPRYEAKCTTRVRLSDRLGGRFGRGSRGCMAFALFFLPLPRRFVASLRNRLTSWAAASGGEAGLQGFCSLISHSLGEFACWNGVRFSPPTYGSMRSLRTAHKSHSIFLRFFLLLNIA